MASRPPHVQIANMRRLVTGRADDSNFPDKPGICDDQLQKAQGLEMLEGVLTRAGFCMNPSVSPSKQ